MPAQPEPTKPKSSKSKSSRSKSSAIPGLPGWDRLRHGGLLFDARRTAELRRFRPEPLPAPVEDELRRLGTKALDAADPETLPPFVTFVLTKVCGFSVRSGSWLRGNAVPPPERRRAVTGEMVTPRALWTGDHGARLPVFFDDGRRLGIGQSRRSVSRVVEWLRAGNEHLALLTNGRQWRLLFAGLDYDAWCEWDLDSWFHEGRLSDEVETLRTLLSPPLWTPAEEGADPPLLRAIRDTRKGQAEISEVLGERVREAVEILIRGHGEALKSLGDTVAPADLYRAACRVVMRMVVVLYAESRELLPTGNALYAHSYGLGSLRESLERDAAAGRPLAESRAAWPRILALFSLIHDGSAHSALPVFAYGGDLFASGDAESDDGLSRALWLFETACFERETLFDDSVHRMLEKLTRTTIRVRQGKSSVRVAAPVDFSDLSSEYLGVLYEGLLDYELKTAPVDDPVIFLTVGNQPALPLSRLDAMDDRALAALFEKSKKADTENTDEGEAEEEDRGPDNASGGEREEAGDGASAKSATGEDAAPEAATEYRTRADRWARKAVVAAKLVRKLPASASPERRLAHERKIAEEARRLTARLVRPGDWYLVRWGGTRKGSGSFYTRPGLAIPTVQRTLRPLTHDPPLQNGSLNRDAPAAEWTPKKPEDILALTVCDPACGSGTFPLAALRFLTDALYASLWHHGRIEPDGERSVVRLLGLADSEDPDDRSGEELIPCPPDADRFEPRLKAILRRYVVERCIYAVDLDPLAVELCRLSLWIETMDRELPFGFLDHKIKCGNALVGAWFDTFRHYPVMAWKNRKGGDEDHKNGVHFAQGTRAAKIKEFRDDRLKPDLLDFLSHGTLFREDQLATASRVHDEAHATLQVLHSLPVHDPAKLARRYRADFLGSPEWRALKAAMDLWCSCWFWPPEEIEVAPLPTTFDRPSVETRRISSRTAERERFFHWELEFPDVFREERSGFDAILGNPPWDAAKPNSTEFFSNLDPVYRAYGKQEAVCRQSEYFADREVESDWLSYGSRLRAQSNFVHHACSPFGHPAEAGSDGDKFTITRKRRLDSDLRERWREARRANPPGYSDPGHGFRHQGSADVNFYKLFLEAAYGLLRQGGRLGFIVPSGLYSDRGTRALRDLFLDRSRWEWLFGFENRRKIFPIDSRYKYTPSILEKGGATEAVRAAFMRHDLDDWERAEEIAAPYGRAQIERLSPKNRAFVEVQSGRDLEILEKIYATSVLLGDDGNGGWRVSYATEFHMTNDSHLFSRLTSMEEDGFRPDEYSRWLAGEWREIAALWPQAGTEPAGGEQAEATVRPVALAGGVPGVHGRAGEIARTAGVVRCAREPYDRLSTPRAQVPEGVILSRGADAWICESEIREFAVPVYQGIMIQAFTPSARGWVSGTGLGAKWDYRTPERVEWTPQYLMRRESAASVTSPRAKIGYRRIARSTDFRSFIGAVCPPFPCGDSVFILEVGSGGVEEVATVAGLVNSLVFDYAVRSRLGGTNLSWYAVEECPLVERGRCPDLRRLVVALNLAPSAQFSPHLASEEETTTAALLPAERLRLRTMMDAVVGAAYGLNFDDLRHILRDCDWRLGANREFDVRGFWRVDRDQDPELRHTVLTIVAFHDLQEKIEAAGGDRERGIAAFLDQNDGEGWMLPETLRLADYGLGHDERAQHPQPVRSRLGPRFHDWQLAQSPEERWRETRLHARNLLGPKGYGALLAERIERRLAEGKPYLDLLRLTDDYERRLAGDPGQVAMLAELYARKVPDPPGWWNWITALRSDGHLPDDRYRELLDELRERRLLTETEHADLLRGAPPPLPIPADEALPLAAEPRQPFELRSQPNTERGDLFEEPAPRPPRPTGQSPATGGGRSR